MAQAAYGQQPAYYPQQQNKGPLVPGQTITVNTLTVQVERYLSQGGYAHVYVVRTAQPMNGTTQHVLKRVAVPDETMLSEVKKEVDIMRLLKRHPNIVQLVDAAWHRMSTGQYEVFILMEFCSGGGIIDMMNRRLRERLTEGEILQIFVDVCEGVAAMHNLRPALLHRDLKIENILQASQTSFKLCDFGSATPVSRPPTNSNEIRALEADLNRHTTLQYRAPEMVDVHLRRPVDEKSDVWALGVLLYKLCYYTTPFEEHGPLAILNVQYKIPPFPVYSHNMNALIDSMLKEYGAQRPTVFEILTQVHRLRGTTSRFTYNVQKTPALPPRPTKQPTNPLDDLVSYRSPTAQASQSPGSGIQARDKVLEAIAPMRRGRPEQQGSPKKELQALPPTQGDYFGRAQPSPSKSRTGNAAIGGGTLNDPWALKSTTATTSSSRPPASNSSDAWSVEGQTVSRFIKRNGPVSQEFGDSFDGGSASSSATPGLPPIPPSKPSLATQPSLSSTPSRFSKKDAFDGLGFLSSDKPPMTLGEAQKSGFSPNGNPALATTSSSLSRPSSTITTSPSPRPTASPLPPAAGSSSGWRPVTSSTVAGLPPSRTLGGELSVEERFPSLEELDMLGGASSPPGIPYSRERLSVPSAAPGPNLTGGLRPHPASSTIASPVPSHPGGVRSQHVTGTAMREAKGQERKKSLATASASIQFPSHSQSNEAANAPTAPESPTHARPYLTRRHRSSLDLSTSREVGHGSLTDAPTAASPPVAESPSQAPSLAPRQEPRDWLTGDDSANDSVPVLRQSPSKRASVLQNSGSELTRRASEAAQLVEITPALPGRSKTRNVRKDSSSGDEDGPEDAGGHGYQPLGAGRSESPTKRIGKGRQSSVHELVGIYGGMVDKEKDKMRGPPTPSESPTKERRLSKTFGMTPPVPTPSPGLGSRQLTGSRSPALPTPTGSTVSRKPLPDVDRTSSPAMMDGRSSGMDRGSAHRRAATSTEPPASIPLPIPKSSILASQYTQPIESKMRPQSYMFPVQKASSDSPVSPSSLSPPPLAPPSNASARSRLRRSSISDMVYKYEAISVKAGTPTTSSFAISPATQLKVKTEPAASPTAASQRFPKISPGSSPVHSRFPSSLAPPPDSPGKAQSRRSSWGDSPRTATSSPTLIRPSPALSKPLPHLDQQTSGASKPVPTPFTAAARPITQRQTSTDSMANGRALTFQQETSVVSPPPSRRPVSVMSPPTAFEPPKKSERATSGSADDSDPSTPDQPYQGVGRLIAKWQQRGEGSDGGSPSNAPPEPRSKPVGARKLPGVVGVGNKWS